MDSETISECYKAVCGQNDINVNPYILYVLEQTSGTPRNITVKLRGNSTLGRLHRLSEGDVFALTKCLLNKQNVSGLDLRYNGVNDEGAGLLSDLIKGENSRLRSLDLMFNDIEKKGAEVLASSLEHNHCLLSLRLSGNKISNRGALHLARVLQRNNTLQELRLADCDLGTSDMLALCILLKNNSALRSVDISRPLLFSQQEEWTQSFSEMLKLNSSLVELHLRKMGLTDTGVEKLAEGLKQNRCLRYLDLSCNRVACDGARHLAEALKWSTSLEVVDLSTNQIRDEGAVCLSDAIAQSGCILKELSVCRNDIRTEGLLSLSQAMKKTSALTHVYIWGNHLEEPVCQAFRELMSSGRLPPEQTDISAYEVEGHTFLAEVNQSLRKHIYCLDCNETRDVPANQRIHEPTGC